MKKNKTTQSFYGNAIMRKITISSSLFIIPSLFFVLHSQNIAINKSGNSGNAAAILDMSDASNAHLGLLTTQVSLSDTTDATAVPGATTGTIVWNTNNSMSNGFGQGFYFRTGSVWRFPVKQPGQSISGLSSPIPIANGGTDQTSAAAARGSSGLNIDEMTSEGDAAYSIASTNRVVATNATLSAPRTWTLPAANSVNAGQSLTVTDLAGGVSASNNLTIIASGTDKLNGATTGSMVLRTPYGSLTLVSDGSANWAITASTSQRVSSIASASTLTPNASSQDAYVVTALNTAASISSPGLGGEGQKLVIRITDNGTSQGLTWNGIYNAGTDLTLPATTVAGKTIYLGFMFNSLSSKWDLVGRVNGF